MLAARRRRRGVGNPGAAEGAAGRPSGARAPRRRSAWHGSPTALTRLLQRMFASIAKMLAADPVASGVYYVDDHFVPYTGAEPVAKGWNNKRSGGEGPRGHPHVTAEGGGGLCFGEGEGSRVSLTKAKAEAAEEGGRPGRGDNGRLRPRRRLPAGLRALPRPASALGHLPARPARRPRGAARHHRRLAGGPGRSPGEGRGRPGRSPCSSTAGSPLQILTSKLARGAYAAERAAGGRSSSRHTASPTAGRPGRPTEPPTPIPTRPGGGPARAAAAQPSPRTPTGLGASDIPGPRRHRDPAGRATGPARACRDGPCGSSPATPSTGYRATSTPTSVTTTSTAPSPARTIISPPASQAPSPGPPPRSPSPSTSPAPPASPAPWRCSPTRSTPPRPPCPATTAPSPATSHPGPPFNPRRTASAGDLRLANGQQNQ